MNAPDTIHSESLASRAIALIASGKASRGDQLAYALDSDTEAIAAALAPACAEGALVSCKIDRVGSTPVNEYRVSAGGKVTQWKAMPTNANRAAGPKTPPIPPEQVLAAAKRSAAAAKAAHVRTPHILEPTPHTPETTTMTIRERVLAVFEKHGPMKIGQVRKHGNWEGANLGSVCSQLANRGELARLGGGYRSMIYGLPDQQAPADAGGEDKPPRSIHAARAKPAKVKRAYKRRSAGTGEGASGYKKPRSAHKMRSAAKRNGHLSVATLPEVSDEVPAAAELRAWWRDLHITPHDAAAARAYLVGNGAAAANNAFRAAVASDGAILLIGAAGAQGHQIELSRDETRVLVGFLRLLDASMLGAACA